MDQIAGLGGWPVHNMSYVIDDNSALDVRIGGLSLNAGQVYSMAISDYLANGGDHLDLLKEHSYINTGVLLREAIIESWKQTTAEGSKVHVEKDGRVSLLKE